MTAIHTVTELGRDWDILFRAGWSIAVYRLPSTSQALLIAAPKAMHQEPRIVGAPSGFGIQPFADGSGLVIPGTIILTYDFSTYVRVSGDLPSLAVGEDSFSSHFALEATPPRQSELGYAERVRRATRLLQEGVADKVVLSDRVRYEGDFADPIEVFQRLADRYAHAFVALVFTPEYGLWLGASPELLVSWDQGRFVRTMALAGTQPNPGGELDTVAWTQKEIEEHAYVVRDVIERFKQIRLREYDEVGPRTVAAGPVVHLCTEFRIDARETDRPSLADDLRSRLHPTSAVCGTPRDVARDLIGQLEPHSRDLYSGYWGPINVQGASQLFVNLRCMKWYQRAVDLFVGAGITQRSDPDREAQEIQLKADTLRTVLFGQR